jgi:phosphosulfolactate synthase
MSERIPSFSREGKPRGRGLTIASDNLAPIERGFFEQACDYIDYMKIGQSLPLLVDRTRLVERIRYYHELGMKVMSGGTLVQVALKKGFLPVILERLHSLNFDVVEISESSIDISTETKGKMIEKISSLSMEYIFEVGRKDLRTTPSLPYLISKTQEAFDFKSPKVFLGKLSMNLWADLVRQA